MKTVMFESEILSFIRVHHTIMKKQLISLLYKLLVMNYNIEENIDIIESIYAHSLDVIKELANNGKIIASQGCCSYVNPLLSKYDLTGNNNYRVSLTRKQQVAIWYHIANYENIGLNIFVPPEVSDYETFMYWKNRNNDCKCISVITLESKFTSGDPYFNNSSMSENDILEKDKRIIKKYDNFLEYEQNTKTREEFLPCLMNVEPIYLIDNDQWLKKLKMKGEFDRKTDQDNWLGNVKKIGVFSFDYLYQKIIVPSFNYYDFS